MKKFFLLAIILGFSNCFAIPLKVTKIIPDLNLYILDHIYVVQSSRMIDKVKKGHKIDINTDAWVRGESWKQDVVVKEVKAFNHYAGIYVTYYDSVESAVFTPIGLLEGKSINGKVFKEFLSHHKNSEKFESYLQVHNTRKGLERPEKTFTKRYFVQEGEEVYLNGIADVLNEEEESFRHKIYLIYNIDKPDELAGMYHDSVMHKGFLEDKMQGLAIVQK